MTSDIQGASVLLPTVGSGSVGAATSGEVGGATAGGAAITGATTVSSMEDLKQKAPDLYKAIMMGIAMRIRAEQEHANDRIKKVLRESRG